MRELGRDFPGITDTPELQAENLTLKSSSYGKSCFHETRSPIRTAAGDAHQWEWRTFVSSEHQPVAWLIVTDVEPKLRDKIPGSQKKIDK